jgi:hypothetical protein
MKKIKSLLFVLSVLFVSQSIAQSTINNVRGLSTRNSKGTILENKKIVGYYFFYFKDRADKKNNAYEIAIFDDNYNKVSSFEIVRPAKTALVEMVFNGKVFMLHFFDKKGYEFVTFDKSGKQTGSSFIVKKEISKFDLLKVSNNIKTATDNVSIFPNGEDGFIRSTFNKNKKTGYEIVAYDNDAKVMWRYGSKIDSPVYEFSDIVDVSENVVCISVTKKKSQLTKEINMFCLLLSADSGQKLAELELGNDAKGRQSLLKAFINTAEQKVVLIGEYFAPKDDIIKDKSVGLFLRELTLEGEELKTNNYSWKVDVAKFKQDNLDDEDKKDAEKSFRIFFHDVVYTKEGHLFLIGEQFKKQVSAGGVAMKVLAGNDANVSSFEIRVANMVVVEFDKDKKMVDFDLIQKRKSSVLLPAGFGYSSTQVLGYYVKSQGQFDYSFTSRDAEKDKFAVVYNDLDRKETKGSERSDLILGVMSISGTERKNERIPINSEFRSFWIQAAKPGYIAIGEYDRKNKKVIFRMEQVTY